MRRFVSERVDVHEQTTVSSGGSLPQFVRKGLLLRDVESQDFDGGAQLAAHFGLESIGPVQQTLELHHEIFDGDC